MSEEPTPICQCGCGQPATWLITGVDYGGVKFTDDPACQDAADYCDEAAYELKLPFTRKRITT